jgi:hypothetical protein
MWLIHDRLVGHALLSNWPLLVVGYKRQIVSVCWSGQVGTKQKTQLPLLVPLPCNTKPTIARIVLTKNITTVMVVLVVYDIETEC